MDAGQASVQDLLNAAEGLRPIFSCTAVGVAVFLYDYILSLHYEVEHIWKAKWNSVKFFFLLSRYLPFLEFSLLATYVLMDGSDPERCKIRYQSIAWLHCLGLAVTEILLTVRTWAVWEKSTRVGIFLIAFYIACWGPIVALSYFYLHSVEFLVLPRPFDRHCINSGKSMFLTAMWVIILVYDTVILGLMLVRGISALRLSNFHHFPVQKAVYNYGLIYYIYLFILTVVNLACMVSLPFIYINLLSVIERSTYSIFTCRAILHIREQHKRSHSYPSEEPFSQDMSQIVAHMSSGTRVLDWTPTN
ncbi:hypothetical protein FA15DRAFT_757746 [Coprinopsis marcescibilis]|uniref:DUF6533 domain-containing protein n=1 Tax=Coprinopsis marcescibilis TaxID=230819 RepID=A0A5C3KQW4_COPMA|nr:hypothetical protein FA15DRAFT_757746 [Coprinopsis marcescibilis]